MNGCARGSSPWAAHGCPRRGPKPMPPGSRTFAPTWGRPSWPSAGNIRRSGTGPGPAGLRLRWRGKRLGLEPGSRRTRTALRPPFAGSGREVLAGLHEVDFRPALLDQPEVDARRRQVHEFPGMIDRQIVVGLLPEFAQALLVGEAHPASHGDV